MNKVDVLNIEQLPTDKEKITNTQECMNYIQHLQNINISQANVEHLLLHIKAVIDKELWQPDDRSCVQYNQVVVNVAFRSYYLLLKKHNLEDRFYMQFIKSHIVTELILNEKIFIMLQFILLTNQSLDLNPKHLLERLLQAFILAVDSNDPSIISILKAMNLLYKKHSKLEFNMELSLDHIYFCLQSNQMGMRDECVTLLQYIFTNRELALSYFQCVVNYWPWTNRNKLFIIACVLNKYSLNDFLIASDHSKEDFFLGLRSALNYKNLLAPSQSVIKALSGQKSMELLEMSVNILTQANKKELQNFYSQWFSRIEQKDELFEMLQQKQEIAIFIENSSEYLMDNEHSHRLILIFSMFSKQVFQLSKLHFFKLSTELLTNCFQYNVDCQLLIFKFIVDNLANFAIEDCIEFVQSFLSTHNSVDNTQFRNTILGKIPSIINYISKTFCKLCVNSDQTSSLESSILNFFAQLHKDIEEGIARKVYQPKIFYLKLLETLLNSLYTETVIKNAKNCCVPQNQQLGLFLKQNKVFDGKRMAVHLIELLNDPLGFDDALDLMVSLLQAVKPLDNLINFALDLSQKACSSSDVDECNLSFRYIRIAAQNCKHDVILKEFVNNMLSNLQKHLEEFDKDPLTACKTQGGHLFGRLNVIYELVERRPDLCATEFMTILEIVEYIQNLIIKKLNMSVSENVEFILTPASFEDMDKSLEMLVCQSTYNVGNHDTCRKYLLMSFWLTLKACCNLATSIASYEIKTKNPSERRCCFVKRCLFVNVMVLTKCRHKGAIEAAGVSIGKLTKTITSYLSENTDEYNLLHLCLEQLYQVQESNVSTTRRGAGFSIMFLHIIKNEHHSRAIFKRAVENLLKPPIKSNSSKNDFNCDRLEALYLHFLCVLVRDTELREAMSKYYNEIMMAAVNQIDNPEWTVCNAALQLFGALVPKIVGQKQANEFEGSSMWEPSEVTFSEIVRKLPKATRYILNYCSTEKASTRSIILFLEFLHKVEYINKGSMEPNNPAYYYRKLMWSLLRHNSEKVRKLAAKCFVRSHEFRVELPDILEKVATMLFAVKNENFFEGLVCLMEEGILKLQHESMHIVPEAVYQEIIQWIKQNLQEYFPKNYLSYKFYTLCKLWDLFKLLNHFYLMELLKELAKPEDKLDKMLGYDLWLDRIKLT